MSDPTYLKAGLAFRECRMSTDNSLVGVTATITVDGKQYEGEQCATRGEALVSAMRAAYPGKEITPQAAMSQALVNKP